MEARPEVGSSTSALTATQFSIYAGCASSLTSCEFNQGWDRSRTVKGHIVREAVDTIVGSNLVGINGISLLGPFALPPTVTFPGHVTEVIALDVLIGKAYVKKIAPMSRFHWAVTQL